MHAEVNMPKRPQARKSAKGKREWAGSGVAGGMLPRGKATIVNCLLHFLVNCLPILWPKMDNLKPVTVGMRLGLLGGGGGESKYEESGRKTLKTLPFCLTDSDFVLWKRGCAT
ncbi:unnamed protein product [Protopolystoma xenopodis]|uniref:Uncharacterized protein n=1 Tax=Protopolystoma xenopodis TaxID=117903 RepID=A0A448WZX6_9PLAT|nr:unnamed protein product [Protopolystoma xenopodis]